MRRIYVYLGIVFLAVLFVLGACQSDDNNSVSGNDGNSGEQNNDGNNGGNGDEGNENGGEVDEYVSEFTADNPVTITIAHPFGEDIFEDRYGIVQEQLDHINLEMVYFDGTADGLEELFAGDIVPDIFNTGSVDMLREYDAIIPMDELAAKHNFDTDIIQPSLVAFLESFDDDQRIIGIPDGASYFALYYNKEVFDMFGEDYPNPNEPMTWDEVLNLARDMTAERNNVRYIGLEFHGNDMTAPINQFAINLTDPDTGDVLVREREEVTRYLDLIDEYYSIPGMSDEEVVNSCLFCEGQAAMSVGWHGIFLWGELGTEAEEVEKFDIAPVPVWSDMPNVGPYLASWPIMVSSYSEHPDEAFQVLMAYLSEENQLRMAETVSAGPTTLYPTVLENLGAAHHLYEGKNLPAITQLEPAVGEQRQSARWDVYVDLNSAITQLRETGDDVPTVLRKLEEESAAKIAEAKARE